MKKQLTVALGLAVLATPAFASKARLAALGEDKNGSFYINDNRNIFLNASEVNNHKDFVTMEVGAADDATTPGEGGVFLSNNNMVYGVQLGRQLSFNQGEAALGTAGTAAATNALDLFVGGDAGMKWGAQLTHSSQKDDGTADNKTSVMDLAVGVTHGDIAGYIDFGVAGKAENGDDEVKRKSAMELGVSYKWDNYTAFAQYGMGTFESEIAAAEDEIKSTNMQLGVGRAHKLNDKATLYTKVAYETSNDDQDSAADEVKEMRLPVTVALEYDAAAWLTLRGSIKQNLTSKIDNGKNDGNEASSTALGAGASLKFGEFSIDGVVGNGTATGVAGTADHLRTDALLTQLSFNYRF